MQREQVYSTSMIFAGDLHVLGVVDESGCPLS
jgi:hypothetical protein